jgi:hypothetical protein
MIRDYKVGYKKPPVEHQFKAGNSNGRKKATPKRRTPEFAKQLDQPLRAQRGGRTIALHPFEAGINSLVREALRGKPQAVKNVLRIFEKAGLLNALVGAQTHSSLVIPKGFTLAAFLVLLSKLGYPPWAPETFAAAKAEYASDRAQIDELYRQFLKGRTNA